MHAQIPEIVRDDARLRALRQYQILDTDPEPAFDRITTLASHLFDAPTAIVNFIDADRQWFKSTVGLDETETGLDVSFCVYTVEAGTVQVVEDLSRDDRFVDNPYVRDEGMRFYAGAPLTTPEGHRLGTLCVLDTAPQSPSDEVLDRLSDLASMVIDELELRKEMAEHETARADLRKSGELLRQSQELANVGGWTYDPVSEELTWTAETCRIHDLPVGSTPDVESAFEFYTSKSRSLLRRHVRALLEDGGTYDLELDLVTADGNRRRVRTIGKAHRRDGETTQLTGAIQDITERHRTKRLQEIQSSFFELIASGAPIDGILDDLCRAAEQQLENGTVSILRREEGGLVPGAAPSLPASVFEKAESTSIGPEGGACGAAAHDNRDVIVEDVRGQERWAEATRAALEAAGIRSCWCTPIQGEDDRVLGTFSVYRTESGTPTEAERTLMQHMAHVAGVALQRQKQEQALRRSEETFRTVVENAQPVVFMVDRDGTFLLSEGKDLASLGLEPGEVVGESVFDLYDEHPEIIEGVRRALRGEHVDDEVEFEGLVFDNWFSPFYDEDGAVAGCIGRAADVTERKQMERNLREREERLQVAQRIAHLGYWRLDLETETLHWNDETRRIFGWPDGRAVTREAFLEAVHPDDRERLRAAQEAVVAGEERLDVEYRIRRPSGEERVLRERGGLRRDEQGAPVSVMGAVLDVTDRIRQREELREAKEAAEEADRIKTALLSNMSHEFQTPLTSIISFSEIIRDNPEVADRFAERIRGGGKRLLYTLNTVMDFAELERTDPPTSPAVHQVDGVVRSVVNRFRERADRARLEMRTEIADDVRSLALDQHRLERILTHLLHNAVKFTEEGRVSVSVSAVDDAVGVSVQDTGVGIDPAFLPQVFDEFAQASSGFDRKHEGNGLGLTVVKRLVEQVGGAVDIDSEPGEGTEVTVRLPVGA